MTDVRLQTLIEKAFEDRAKITPATRGEARDAVEEALDLLDRGKARVAEKLPGATGPEFVEGQPVAEEGGALELPPQRQCADRGRPGPGDLVGQDSLEIRRLGARTGSRTRASAPFLARSCGARPSSAAMWS